MEVEKSTGGGGSVASSFSLGLSDQRKRFSIELTPGETTIVSWKRLVNDTNNENPSPPAPEPTLPGVCPNLGSRAAPDQITDPKPKDAPTSNRFCAVTEKIERLYMGKGSSDEEELVDVPDDDQYDTEDSFIDDAELDAYFQVDQSRTKHDGFFVNRGKLENINESAKSANYQPKKRRKGVTKAVGEKEDIHLPTKHAKLEHAKKKYASKNAPCVGKSSIQSQSFHVKSEHYRDGKSLYPLNASMGSSTKKPADPGTKLDFFSFAKTSNRDASGFPVEAKDIDKTGIATQYRDMGNKADNSDAAYQKFRDKKASAQFQSQSRRLGSNTNVQERSTKVQHGDKYKSNDLPDLNLPWSYPGQPLKTSSMHVKDASGVRLKGITLERAIRELEKMVAVSRPPHLDVQDVGTSSLAIKKRLPREVKQKLAKVAKLAQSSQGKISEELINRLMGILGHLVQLKTLKRNLREMVLLGLSAEEEKDDRFKQIKKEVAEMIKLQAPSLKAKELSGSEEKGVHKGIYSIDNTMEDKICDLYDLYVQGMEEGKAPRVRKLYVQLAELWPNGAMDNHGIKNAICRAKERRRALYIREQDREKRRRKKLSTPRTDEIVRGPASSVAQPRTMPERLITDTSGLVLALPNKVISSTPAFDQHHAAPAKMSSPPSKGPDLDPLKQGKLEILKEPAIKQKLGSGSKAKKLSLKREKDSNKFLEQDAGPPLKSSHLSAAPPSSHEGTV